MKWLKQQITEITAWIGLMICLTAFFTPDWVTFALGILLIAIDDNIATNIKNKLQSWAGDKLDRLSDED